jgi:hypothetical protein
MSFADRAIIEEKDKQNVAVEIALKVGVLKPCKFGICNELVWDDSKEQLESAYKYAARVFKSKSPLTQGFKNQTELTDMIKNLSNDFSVDCACQRLIDKD